MAADAAEPSYRLLLAEVLLQRRLGMVLAGSPAVPQDRLLRVKHDELAEAIEVTKMELGHGETLFGGAAEQGDAGVRISNAAKTLDVHVAEIGLGPGIILVGRTAVPQARRLVVLFNAVAETIEMT
jgi:hypothetical protein